MIAYLHGGGLYAGNNQPLLYGPDYFMDTRDVILVTLSYRVNIFGFLATGDDGSPGNYGLKDITMALRWIRDNIGAFGGDPNKVTLMGQSGGAVAVNYHLLSNHSQGLYKNAYLISGAAVRSYGEPLPDPRGYVNRHARALGVENPEQMSSVELVQRFREMPAKRLVATLPDLYDWDILPVANYLPAVEAVGSPDPFLTVHPREAQERGLIQNVPILNSILPRSDGFNFVQPIIRLLNRHEEFNQRIYELMPIVLGLPRTTHPNMTYIVDRVRTRYFGPGPGLVNPQNFHSVLQMITDRLFGRPYFEAMEAFAGDERRPVFGHYFDYHGEKSFSVIFARSLREFGAVHTDDLLYLFRIRLVFPIQLVGSTDKQFQEFYMNDILQFIKNDDPGFEEYTRDSKRIAFYDESNDEPGFSRTMTNIEPLEFWDEILDLYESA